MDTDVVAILDQDIGTLGNQYAGRAHCCGQLYVMFMHMMICVLTEPVTGKQLLQ